VAYRRMGNARPVEVTQSTTTSLPLLEIERLEREAILDARIGHPIHGTVSGAPGIYWRTSNLTIPVGASQGEENRLHDSEVAISMAIFTAIR